jgi:hypothetical protein
LSGDFGSVSCKLGAWAGGASDFANGRLPLQLAEAGPGLTLQIAR